MQARKVVRRSHPHHTRCYASGPTSFEACWCLVCSLAVRRADARLAGYLTPVTIGERIVALPVEFSADIRQAEVFYSSLAQLRAELCDQLDEQAMKLVRYERVQEALST